MVEDNAALCNGRATSVTSRIPQKSSKDLKDWILTLHQRSCSVSMAANSLDVIRIFSTPV